MPTATPRDQALAAAVPGARGWFRFNGDGAVNVRYSGAVFTPQYDDEQYRVVVAGEAGNYEISVGPFSDGGEAGSVTDAVLQLAYDDASWPTVA